MIIEELFQVSERDLRHPSEAEEGECIPYQSFVTTLIDSITTSVGCRFSCMLQSAESPVTHYCAIGDAYSRRLASECGVIDVVLLVPTARAVGLRTTVCVLRTAVCSTTSVHRRDQWIFRQSQSQAYYVRTPDLPTTLSPMPNASHHYCAARAKPLAVVAL
jgi:hypothetical protein